MPKKPKRDVLQRQAYTMAVVDGKHAELTMYGDIVETRPIDWWTDEPVEGNFIMQDEFLADLDTIKGCDDLLIHLNSCGGDAFVSIAIHNRLRELSDAGMDITCIVDGAAMSGGSLIMCACDHVKVNPSSVILIHDCWSYAWDRFNSTKLRKLADDLDVINESQAEIYARKSGMDIKEIREMMSAETMMTGRSAVNKGIADELLDGESDVAVSADHRSLIACGRKMRFAAMGELPEGIKVVETPEALTTQGASGGGDKNQAEPSAAANITGGVKAMTLDEFRAENPEVAEALIAEAQASVSHAEAEEAARTSERQRCEEIDALAGVFDAETIRAAKYGENPCTAQEMAFRAAQEMAKQGKSFLNQMQADYKESGADGVSAAPAPEEDAKAETAEDRKAQGLAMAKKLSGEKSEEV
jgi:ATP-dependent protease ClpP protease subunit